VCDYGFIFFFTGIALVIYAIMIRLSTTNYHHVSLLLQHLLLQGRLQLLQLRILLSLNIEHLQT
jgi:hypothetical protein